MIGGSRTISHRKEMLTASFFAVCRIDQAGSLEQDTGATASILAYEDSDAPDWIGCGFSDVRRPTDDKRRQPLRRAVKSGRQDLNLRPHGLEPDGLRRTEMTQVVTEIMLQILGPAVGSFRFLARSCGNFHDLSPLLRHGRDGYVDATLPVGWPLSCWQDLHREDDHRRACDESSRCRRRAPVLDRGGAFSAQGVIGAHEVLGFGILRGT